MNECSVGWRIDHGIWPPLCACCGSTTGTEDHHLYLRSEGCPDDLTVWLCHICARGVKLGNPKLTENLDRAVASTKAEAIALPESSCPSSARFRRADQSLVRDAFHDAFRRRELVDELVVLGLGHSRRLWSVTHCEDWYNSLPIFGYSCQRSR
jgi:hypothetical protein